MRRARIKSVCAEALGISRKNIYRELKQPAKDLVLKQQIEAAHRQHPAYGHRRMAIHRHIHYYNHSRIHTALKMPPAVYAAQTASDICLQKTCS